MSSFLYLFKSVALFSSSFFCLNPEGKLIQFKNSFLSKYILQMIRIKLFLFKKVTCGVTVYKLSIKEEALKRERTARKNVRKIRSEYLLVTGRAPFAILVTPAVVIQLQPP